jgi:hypothetical protein
MKEPYDQGLANQIGPVPCADVREGMGEASVRGSAGWVLSRESNLRDADPVGDGGRQHGPEHSWRVPWPVSRGHRPQARNDAPRTGTGRSLVCPPARCWRSASGRLLKP